MNYKQMLVQSRICVVFGIDIKFFSMGGKVMGKVDLEKIIYKINVF